jgi:hypothetical protein
MRTRRQTAAKITAAQRFNAILGSTINLTAMTRFFIMRDPFDRLVSASTLPNSSPCTITTSSA